MKRTLPIILLSCCLLYASNLRAQAACQQEVVYRTSSVGSGAGSWPLALMFIFQQDTLRIAFNEKTAKAADNVPFTIKEKDCHWNADYTSGMAFYKLELNDKGVIKHPTLTLEIKTKKGKIILQYENSEPRVFELVL